MRSERKHEQNIPRTDSLSADHIAHHILTLYALAAPPAILQKQYDDNKSYQRPTLPLETRVVQDLNDHSKYHDYLENEKYYPDFLVFFQQEIDKKGWEAVINEYVLKGDELADDMLARMYAGEYIQGTWQT